MQHTYSPKLFHKKIGPATAGAGGLPTLFGINLTPRPPDPVFDKRGLVEARAPRTFDRTIGSSLGGSKARREVSRDGAAPRVWDVGSEAGTRGIGGPDKGPYHPRIPWEP